ncbi:uncharacterized protein METZ01_LOCUS225274, partial [marine metagenome]
ERNRGKQNQQELIPALQTLDHAVAVFLIQISFGDTFRSAPHNKIIS